MNETGLVAYLEMGDTGDIDNDFVADGCYNDWVAYFNKHGSTEDHVTLCQDLYGYDTTPIEYPGDRLDFVQILEKKREHKTCLIHRR